MDFYYFVFITFVRFTKLVIMRKILIIGAGKSSSYLIKYLIDKSQSENLEITIGDLNVENAKKLVGDNSQS